MSFSTTVKTELASLHHLECCNLAELSALYHVGGSIEISSKGTTLVFQTTNNAVIRKVTKLMKDMFHINTVLLSKKQTNFQKHDLFVMSITENVNEVIQRLSITYLDYLPFQETDPNIFEKECCKKAYLRGAFLAGGSLNSPETSSYHLEIQSSHESHAILVANIAKEFHLNAKVSKNKRGFITYLKEAEKIADFLRVVGATNSLFEYEDSRIKRDFKNSINRVINCDIANEKKALDAAEKQLEYIEIIEKYLRSHQIPKSMQEAIFLRKTYPESTLHELSYASLEHYEDQISKSALNHRFRAIKDLALRLEIEKEMKT